MEVSDTRSFRACVWTKLLPRSTWKNQELQSDFHVVGWQQSSAKCVQMRIPLSIVCLLYLTNLFAQTKKIAITIDDLPCTNCQDLSMTLQVNTKLLKTLYDYKVPAIGFVNEIKFYTEGSPDPAKINILKNWLASGLTLGNHTFSHVSIDNTTIEEYENEIVKGGIIISGTRN